MTQQDKRAKTTHAAPADISPLVSPAGLACAKHPPNAVHASACSSSSSFEISRKQDIENVDTSTKKQKTTSSNATWKFTLQGSCMGVQLDKPSWYMQRESQAVMPMGTQSLSTCGLHAVNHALHALPGFRCRTWTEFDAHVPPHEFDENGNWEFAALQANIQAAGASIEPILPEDLIRQVTWSEDGNRLRLWNPNTFGLIVHIPGHWIAIVRPEGASSTSNVATLCDSLRPQPFQINHAEIMEMMSCIQQFLQRASMANAGQWSVYRAFA